MRLAGKFSDYADRMKNTQLKIAVNSLAYFLLAYYVLILLTNGFTILLLNLNGIQAWLTYFGVQLAEPKKIWPSDLKLLVFFFGTGFSFVLGILSERFYKKTRRHTNHLKIFFLWFYLLAFAYFFGNVIVGAFFFYGPGVVFDQWGMPMIIRLVFGLIAVAALILIGFFSTRNVLISFNVYKHHLSSEDFSALLWVQFFVPFLAGNLIIFLLKIPHQADFLYLDTLVLISLLITLVTIFLNARNYSSIRFKRKHDHFQFLALPIIFAVLLTVFYRLCLG